MTVAIAALIGLLAGRMLWLAMRDSWNHPALMRTNYRGVNLPTAGGIVLAFALLVVEALRGIFGAVGVGEDGGLQPMRAAALIVIVGFALLGLIDDLLGSSKNKGLAGHLKALARGELTTGGLKFLGGIALAFVGASLLGSDGIAELVINAAIIALAANLFNLFDLRPGRATKIAVLVFVVMAVVTALRPELLPVAIVVGAALALLLDDMHERVMLGDTGANALGAAIGLGIVATTGTTGAIVALVVLMALNLLSEFVSFSKLFESIVPLRAFDNLGRRSVAPANASTAATQSGPERRPEPSPAPETDEYEDDTRYEDELPETQAYDQSVEEAPESRVDLRDQTRIDDIDLDGDDEPRSPGMSATVERAHVGGTASSSLAREHSPSASPTRERSATSPTLFGGEDDFDDLDFSGPTVDRDAQPRAERPFRSERPTSVDGERRRSPFDDDEDF